MKRALANADIDELVLFENYLAKRQAMRQRVEWVHPDKCKATTTKGLTERRPKTEDELEWFVLDSFHFCHNFREDDPTSVSFRKAMTGVDDGYTLFCSSVIHAVLANWGWFELLVKTACMSLVFNPDRLVTKTANCLAKKLDAVVREWVSA